MSSKSNPNKKDKAFTNLEWIPVEAFYGRCDLIILTYIFINGGYRSQTMKFCDLYIGKHQLQNSMKKEEPIFHIL